METVSYWNGIIVLLPLHYSAVNCLGTELHVFKHIIAGNERNTLLGTSLTNVTAGSQQQATQDPKGKQ